MRKEKQAKETKRAAIQDLKAIIITMPRLKMHSMNETISQQ